MIKIEIQGNKINTKTNWSFYNSINPIPFSITEGEHTLLPPSIYARNIYKENFIEFRFHKDSLLLFEVTMVAMQSDKVATDTSVDFSMISKQLNNFKVNLTTSILENELPIEILRGDSFVIVNIGTNNNSILQYHAWNSNCLIGLNQESFLSAIVLINLSQENIIDIFGY